MNWLAHLLLSEPTPAFRIGNLLPDLIPPTCFPTLPLEFRRGIERHRAIDAFTDAHPVVRRSMRRIPPPFHRYAGILVDIFYDHLLAREWLSYSALPLREFADEFHADIETCRADLPAEAALRLEQIREADLLCSYRELEGIRGVLRRMSYRLRRPVPLAEALPILEEHYESFQADFAAFFPELRAHF